jgi:calcineurin-like phosphoesterase family protein
MKRKKPRIFLTSDTFFGRHLSAIERGFESSEDMEDSMIESWNSTVDEGDVVYHLGNFAWDPISAETAINFLNGKIFFVLGKHDTYLPTISLIKTGVHSLYSNQIGILKEYNAILSHWPLLDWPGKEDGFIQYHGGEVSTNIKESRINVNCKNWSLKPIELDTILDIVKISNEK